MNHPPASLTYRRAALQQASTVGLVIALYDTLAGDLARAAVALENDDIEVRCQELSHGFRVLHQLDLMLDMQNGGQAAINLRRFYNHLRGQMLTAQFKRSAAVLRDQIRIVLDVRDAWQRLDTRSNGATEYAATMQNPQPSMPAGQTSGRTYDATVLPHKSFSCSG